MVDLPDPPTTLPAPARAFYDELSAVLGQLDPTDVDAAAVEVAFGDGGIAVTLPHAREPDWTLAAQVSRGTAVVFAGPATAHFDASDGEDWTSRAVALMARALRGDLELEVAYRGDQVVRVGGDRVHSLAGLAVWRPVRVERVRVDFGGRAARP